MLSGIVSFIGGLGDFASYITGYFKNKKIADTQKNIDVLEERVRTLESIIKSEKIKCEREKELIRSELEQSIDKISAELDSINPVIGGRVIEG